MAGTTSHKGRHMSTIDKLTKLALQYHRGVLSEQELRWEITEVVVRDRQEVLQAERNGTLHIAQG